MPNWVTNKVRASEDVIRYMLNDEGRVDFEKIVAFPGPCGKDWVGINVNAELAAAEVCGASGQYGEISLPSRHHFDVKTVPDEVFEQFIGMLRNWRACGYLHDMDFNREVWGSKWNACESGVILSEGYCEFQTAWSCPRGALAKLSERFPEELIEVVYADEDRGVNCGTILFKGGQIVHQDIAPPFSELDDAGKAKWMAFAYMVTAFNLNAAKSSKSTTTEHEAVLSVEE